MFNDYEIMVRKYYDPLINQYKLKFVKENNDSFFLVGNGFALNIFIDRMDRRGDILYVSLSCEGIIRIHTLMYINKERFTEQDRMVAGNPKTVDEYIEATFRVDVSGLRNHCSDILSGDTQWLKDYPDQGDYNKIIAQFITPYFQQQGHYVKLMEE